jgi:hypothetical protein
MNSDESIPNTPPKVDLKAKLQERRRMMKFQRSGKEYRMQQNAAKKAAQQQKSVALERNSITMAVRQILHKANIPTQSSQDLETKIVNELIRRQVTDPMEMAQIITRHLQIYESRSHRSKTLYAGALPVTPENVPPPSIDIEVDTTTSTNQEQHSDNPADTEMLQTPTINSKRVPLGKPSVQI